MEAAEASSKNLDPGAPLVRRHFTSPGLHPFHQIEWKKLDVEIKSPEGELVFSAKGVEVPEFWSTKAATVVAEKYFRVINGVRETSARDMVHRVASTISNAALNQGLVSTPDEHDTMYAELCYLLIHQKYAFNSPVWFNIGVPGVAQQASACFIQEVLDDMESLTSLQKKEVRLFKGGSGTGSSLSNLRSSREKLKNGGMASGPVSFMLGFDAWAGVTKSGGGTRRAAKMVVLNVEHPDILVQANGRPGFITCKSWAEQLAHDIYSTGKYSAEFNAPGGNIYDFVPFQNANNSVSVTDEFMEAVKNDGVWKTKLVTTGEDCDEYKAQHLWEEIAKAAHFCGDPGLQFRTTINKWHTIPNHGPINASNPCSEYLHIDDSACNLGSLNLGTFLKADEFNADDFAFSTQLCILAMETLVGYSSYPSEKITENSRKYRPLGIGYANLGSLLMKLGLAYDSDEGRAIAAAITAIMSGSGYAQSARMAQKVGAFEGFATNRGPMLNVIRMHLEAAKQLKSLPKGFEHLADLAVAHWEEALALGEIHGFRNSQISVMAPTGTISFLMDCDTSGIEPVLALVVYKKLVGGGMLKMPNQSVGPALRKLGYSEEVVKEIEEHIKNTDGKLPDLLKAEHVKVFQTAIGENDISVDGHLLMMAAIQPFLSGGISKTVNMPKTATVEDVKAAYMKAWELGLKCVALYPDGCKLSQPASSKLTDTSKKGEASTGDEENTGNGDTGDAQSSASGLAWGQRKRLPATRKSIIHKFSIGGQEGYLHVGMYDDGSPAELFVNFSKAGSTLHGLADMVATSISIGLQHGVPLHTLIEKFKGMKFEPAGFTENEEARMVSSFADYLARWLESVFYPADGKDTYLSSEVVPAKPEPKPAAKISLEGPPCRTCGNVTMKSGTCFTCTACGTTTGCS